MGRPGSDLPLRETVVRLWQVERDVSEHINLMGMQHWWDSQDELVYALG